MMNVLDIFSGVGGFSLGLERTGAFKTVAFCEIEPYPRKVLQGLWPNVPIYEDIKTFGPDVVRRDGLAIDVIAGGFPCQDLSIANVFGGGLDGERSGLWKHYARLVRDLRPRYVIVENVANLLGRGFGIVLGDLAALGYDAEWAVVPAAAIGAPHLRERIWIVAYPSSERREGHQSVVSILEREIEASTQHGDSFTDAWRALDGDFSGLRVGDGLSVAVERRKVKCTGNAVVPQIVECIGRAIVQFDACVLDQPS